MKLLFILLSVISVLDTTICKDESITLTSTYVKSHYRWRNANTGAEVGTTNSFVFNADAVGSYRFTCEPYNDSTEIHDAMEGANGDFESGYTGFTSSFKPISKGGTPVINPKKVYSGGYDNGTDYGHYYMITNNAADIQDGVNCIFYPIKPHGGKEFLLVDADNEGYAWQVSNLAIEGGKTYEFSYWATIPNTGKELNDPKAKLQFVISYKNKYGFFSDDIALLPSPHELGLEAGDAKYDWHQKKATWTAPADAVSVTIGVKDLTSSAVGNDFCLDDIVFMPQGEPQSAIVETFDVKVTDCTTPDPDPVCVNLIYTKWDDFLVVNNSADTLASYQWYRDGVEISGATLQYYRDNEGVADHTYMVKGLTTKGKKYVTCEVKFSEACRSQTLVNTNETKKIMVRHFNVGAHLMIEETFYEDGSHEVMKYLK